MSGRGFLGQSPWAASRSGDRAARQKQSSSQVLPGTLPVSEPWSQPQARSFSEDNTASPAHLAPQDLLSPGPSRMISAAPPKQTFTPGYTNSSPSTLAKHQLPGKEPHGATRNSSVHPSCSERGACAQHCQPQQARGRQEPIALCPTLTAHLGKGPRTQFHIQNMEHPENTSCPRSLGKAGEKQKTKAQTPPASARNSYTQTARPCLLRALSHRSLGCAWRNVTYSRLGTSAAQGGEATANWQL